MTVRASFPKFILANDAYIVATLTLYTVDGNGDKTTTLATLYSGATGTGTLGNPQTLDSEGKLAQAVYVETAVIATVSGLSIADHDIGIFHPTGSWRGDWATATLYYAGEYVRAGAAADGTNDIYSVEQTHTSGTFATDVSGGQLTLAIDVSTFSAVDATLAALAALVTVADQMIYSTGVDTFAMASLTAAARALLDDADAGAMLTTLGVTDFAKTILDDANAAAVRATLDAQADLDVPSQAEAEAGTATDERVWTSQRVTQGAIAATLPDAIQVFEASDTYTKPAGLVSAMVIVVSGGGSGGGGESASNAGGAGGGGGGTAIETLLASVIGATETVTIGTAGAAASAGSNGSAGGTSSFGALLSATGGAGGGVGSASAAVGGSGGLGSGSDLNIAGHAGGSGPSTTGTTTNGASGGGTTHGGGGASGGAGGPYGGGGGGGTGNGTSGAGALGVVFVLEYF